MVLVRIRRESAETKGLFLVVGVEDARFEAIRFAEDIYGYSGQPDLRRAL
jgi:hypothetical protein